MDSPQNPVAIVEALTYSHGRTPGPPQYSSNWVPVHGRSLKLYREGFGRTLVLSYHIAYIVTPKKLEFGLRTIGAGIP